MTLSMLSNPGVTMNKQMKNTVTSVYISPHFKMILLSVVGLTLLSLGVSLFFSLHGKLTQPQSDLFTTCSTTWKMGFGAVVGLIGGKAA